MTALPITTFALLTTLAATAYMYSRLRLLQSQQELHQKHFQRVQQAAHDIRSPLLALRAITESPNRPTEQTEVLTAVSQRINDLAEDILASDIADQPSKCHLEDFMNAADSNAELILVNDLLAEICEEKNWSKPRGKFVSIENDASYAPPIFLRQNRHWLYCTLSNLVDNAIEAISDSGTVTLHARVGDGLARIYISDDGSGIDEADLPRLGTRGFSQNKQNGHGLGLYSAREFARANGGNLQINTSLGNGTTVVLSLPQT